MSKITLKRVVSLREAIINFVAFLGWNPGDEREMFTLEDLVKEFSLERVGKSGAVFNVEKLDWLNFQHLRRKPDTEVLAMLREHLKQSSLANRNFDDAYLLSVIGAMGERVTFVRDFVEKSGYFFQAPNRYDPDVLKKRWKPDTPQKLRRLIEEFSLLENPQREDYESALLRVVSSLEVKNSELIHPLRLAVSGVGAGPGLYDILFILGKEETHRRVVSAIERLAQLT